jgi:hypothetical protein
LKGIEPTILGLIAVTVIGGSMVALASNNAWQETDKRIGGLEQELSQFERSITLSNNSVLAKRQLRATTYIVTLRSVHCSVLYNAYTGGISDSDNTPNNLAPDEQYEDNKHFKWMIWAVTLDEPSIRDFECRGKGSIWKITGLQQIRSEVMGGLSCLDNLVRCGAEELQEQVTDGLRNLGQALYEGRPVVGDMVDYSEENPPQCYMCNDTGNSQPGRFGNVEFEYPSQATGPMVIDADEFYFKPAQKIEIREVTSDAYFDDSDDWNGFSGKDEAFWKESRRTKFAPDPRIIAYNREGQTDSFNIQDNNIYKIDFSTDGYEESLSNYPIKPFRPAMKKVPLVTNKPLFKKWGQGTKTLRDGGSNSWDAYIDTGPDAYHSRVETTTPNLLFEYGVRNEELKEGFFSSQYEQDNFDVGSVDFTELNSNNLEVGVQNVHSDFEFVLCPGVDGRIQSNVGNPSYSGSQQDKADSVPEYFRNSAFPYIQLTGTTRSNSNCLNPYKVLDTSTWNRLNPQSQTQRDQISGENMDDKLKIEITAPGGDNTGKYIEELRFESISNQDKCVLRQKVRGHGYKVYEYDPGTLVDHRGDQGGFPEGNKIEEGGEGGVYHDYAHQELTELNFQRLGSDYEKRGSIELGGSADGMNFAGDLLCGSVQGSDNVRWQICPDGERGWAQADGNWYLCEGGWDEESSIQTPQEPEIDISSSRFDCRSFQNLSRIPIYDQNNQELKVYRCGLDKEYSDVVPYWHFREYGKMISEGGSGPLAMLEDKINHIDTYASDKKFGVLNISREASEGLYINTSEGELTYETDFYQRGLEPSDVSENLDFMNDVEADCSGISGNLIKPFDGFKINQTNGETTIHCNTTGARLMKAGAIYDDLDIGGSENIELPLKSGQELKIENEKFKWAGKSLDTSKPDLHGIQIDECQNDKISSSNSVSIKKTSGSPQLVCS